MEMSLNKGKKTQIHSYKHDQSLHRVWETAVILDFDEKMIVTGNKNTKVIEHNGRKWYTKEPAICFFYAEKWFNVIAMLKKDGIYYYCNLSSPVLYDGEALKYIDYDLDLKVFPDGTMLVLDEKEYAHHAERMNYDEALKEIINNQLLALQEMVIKKEKPFDAQYVKKYAEEFNQFIKKNKRSK